MRTRSPQKIVIGVAVLSVAAIAAAYFLFFTPDSPDPLRLTDTAGGQATGSSDTALHGTWKVASGSEARYRIREKLAALPAQSDAVGSTPAVTGQVRVERTSGGIAAHDARIEVDLTKLRSDESKRDNIIRNRGLETDKFPTATFVAAEPIRLTDEAATAQPVKVSAVGDLTVHGVTKRVTIPLDAQLTSGRIQVVGSLTFPFSDFGMTAPSIGGFVTVTNNATLEFKLNFDRK